MKRFVAIMKDAPRSVVAKSHSNEAVANKRVQRESLMVLLSSLIIIVVEKRTGQIHHVQ